MEMYDWSQFEVDYYYAAPLEIVRNAWMTPKGLESFFIKRAQFVEGSGRRRDATEIIQDHDRFEWTWDHPFSITGSVLECNGRDLLRFTFGSMEVAVRIESVSPHCTFVRLIQTGIEDSTSGRVMGHLNCRSCWVFFMTNLKAVLEHGVELRDRAHPDRVSCMEVGFQPTHTS